MRWCGRLRDDRRRCGAHCLRRGFLALGAGLATGRDLRRRCAVRHHGRRCGRQSRATLGRDGNRWQSSAAWRRWRRRCGNGAIAHTLLAASGRGSGCRGRRFGWRPRGRRHRGWRGCTGHGFERGSGTHGRRCCAHRRGGRRARRAAPGSCRWGGWCRRRRQRRFSLRLLRLHRRDWRRVPAPHGRGDGVAVRAHIQFGRGRGRFTARHRFEARRQARQHCRGSAGFTHRQ